jgi:hypothetical protein
MFDVPISRSVNVTFFISVNLVVIKTMCVCVGVGVEL